MNVSSDTFLSNTLIEKAKTAKLIQSVGSDKINAGGPSSNERILQNL